VHPAGVQFGLSRGLLELNGDKVVVSEPVLDTISARARLLVQEHGILPIGPQFGDEVVAPGVEGVLRRENHLSSKEIVPLLNGLTLALFNKLVPITEKAHIVRMKGLRVNTTKGFSEELLDRIDDLKPCREDSHPRRLVFEACLDIVAAHCAEYDPSSMRHSELITLFLFNVWDSAGTLSLLEEAVYG
jgi:hypothetical protein